MIKKFTKILIVSSFILLSHCGFKTIDTSEMNKFTIQEIKTTGDKRVGFKIKNNLVAGSEKNNKNILIINLDTKKTKNIKEKNIKNEITKYEISLNIDVRFNLMNSETNYKISLSNKGHYLVADSYSTTLNNEKKLINDLVENVSEKIIRKINLQLNDI